MRIRLERLGGSRYPDRIRQADPVQRHASRADRARDVVRGRPGCAKPRTTGRLPRSRRNPSGNALRHCRAQRPRRVGIHQPSRRCAGPLHRAHPRYALAGPSISPPTAHGIPSVPPRGHSCARQAPTLRSMCRSYATATAETPIISGIFPGESEAEPALEHLRPGQHYSPFYGVDSASDWSFHAQRLRRLRWARRSI